MPLEKAGNLVPQSMNDVTRSSVAWFRKGSDVVGILHIAEPDK